MFVLNSYCLLTYKPDEINDFIQVSYWTTTTENKCSNDGSGW